MEELAESEALIKNAAKGWRYWRAPRDLPTGTWSEYRTQAYWPHGDGDDFDVESAKIADREAEHEARVRQAEEFWRIRLAPPRPCVALGTTVQSGK